MDLHGLVGEAALVAPVHVPFSVVHEGGRKATRSGGQVGDLCPGIGQGVVLEHFTERGTRAGSPADVPLSLEREGGRTASRSGRKRCADTPGVRHRVVGPQVGLERAVANDAHAHIGQAVDHEGVGPFAVRPRAGEGGPRRPCVRGWVVSLQLLAEPHVDLVIENEGVASIKAASWPVRQGGPLCL